MPSKESISCPQCPIPIDWIRNYRAGDQRQGWSCALSVQLLVAGDRLTYLDRQGREVRLPHIPVRGRHHDPYEQCTLEHADSDQWQIVFNDGRVEYFERTHDDMFALGLTGISDRNGNSIRLSYPPAPADTFAVWWPNAITDSAGRILHLRWNKQNLLTAVVPDGGKQGRAEKQRILATYRYRNRDLIAQADARGKERGYDWKTTSWWATRCAAARASTPNTTRSRRPARCCAPTPRPTRAAV